MLAFAAEVTKNEQMAELLSGALAPETLAASFIAVCGEQLDANGQNLIKVMAENCRPAWCGAHGIMSESVWYDPTGCWRDPHQRPAGYTA